MALDEDIFNTIAPELKSENTTRKKEAAKLAELQVTPGRWRDKTDYAVALLTAHILTMANRNGRAGGVQSSTVGSLSRSYGGVAATEALDTTSYGLEFKRVRRQVSPSPFVC